MQLDGELCRLKRLGSAGLSWPLPAEMTEAALEAALFAAVGTKQGHREGLKIAEATGAKDVWSASGNMPTIHLMGGTIMGTEADNSVVNSYGQTHEVPNLYVAGPGIFATSGASNPTYTIFALSLRGAEQLAATWSTVAD
jgi:choline dehydrogenase-like flavoprotein